LFIAIFAAAAEPSSKTETICYKIKVICNLVLYRNGLFTPSLDETTEGAPVIQILFDSCILDSKMLFLIRCPGIYLKIDLNLFRF
jgi:hypothetical protein